MTQKVSHADGQKVFLICNEIVRYPTGDYVRVMAWDGPRSFGKDSLNHALFMVRVSASFGSRVRLIAVVTADLV